MKINRNLNISYIHNGKYIQNYIIYSHTYRNIPIFISDDVSKIQYITLNDGGKLIIINRELFSKLDNTCQNLYVAHMLIEKANKEYDIQLIDYICAYHFGYDNMIKVLNTLYANDDDIVYRLNAIAEKKNLVGVRLPKIENLITVENNIEVI